MTAMSGIKICIYCDKPIEGATIKVTGESQWGSANGARGDSWRHVKGDPACRGRR